MAKLSYDERLALQSERQDLYDILAECDQMLADFDGMPKATVTADDIESSSLTYYSLPMPYILKAVREWQAHTNEKLEAVKQKLK